MPKRPPWVCSFCMAVMVSASQFELEPVLKSELAADDVLRIDITTNAYNDMVKKV